MKIMLRLQILFAIALGTILLSQKEMDAAEDVTDAQAIVSKYVGVYTHPPGTVGSLDPSIHAYRIPDGPLLGNGDLAVAVGGTDTEQTYYLSKSDLSHSLRGLGGLTLSFSGRAGYPAEKVVEALKQMLAGRQPYDDRGDHVQLRDNLTIVPPVHSYEYVGAIEAIHSMLLQSHDRTIRVFPVWIEGKAARFRNLRAYGAFLVSSEYKNGAVDYIHINSEVGGTCTVANPWQGKVCEVDAMSEGKAVKVDVRMAENAIVFVTNKGGHYRIRKQK